MDSLVVLTLLLSSAAWAAPQGYNAPTPDQGLDHGQSNFITNEQVSTGNQYIQPNANIQCAQGQLLNVLGQCVYPEITRNIYVYSAPSRPVTNNPAPVLPSPRVDYNIVFVRAPEGHSAASNPIIVPPPQTRTLVYVLSKKTQGNQIIQVPAGPALDPQVYYVNYADGENPNLPGGFNLQDALGTAQGSQTPGGLGDLRASIGTEFGNSVVSDQGFDLGSTGGITQQQTSVGSPNTFAPGSNIATFNGGNSQQQSSTGSFVNDNQDFSLGSIFVAAPPQSSSSGFTSDIFPGSFDSINQGSSAGSTFNAASPQPSSFGSTGNIAPGSSQAPTFSGVSVQSTNSGSFGTEFAPQSGPSFVSNSINNNGFGGSSVRNTGFGVSLDAANAALLTPSAGNGFRSSAGSSASFGSRIPGAINTGVGLGSNSAFPGIPFTAPITIPVNNPIFRAPNGIATTGRFIPIDNQFGSNEFFNSAEDFGSTEVLLRNGRDTSDVSEDEANFFVNL